MAVFKCKMCGGDLEVTEGMKVVECDFCGTTQTVPTAKDENIQSLFNRANTLRMKSEFDKAEAIYEKIVQAKEDECEAYWGIILCRYGIEYVEDPKTFKRIPTCHRTSFDSVIADEDYKSAIKYADIVQKIVYENEAKEIDRIQKEILELSQKEEPYDVFICYKETDSAGKRTVDSAIANDIYYQLTQEGYKVFYAAITLEDKLGSAYEPCIFAALNSAKVMLAIGTKPEYFNAVWVKNEWSRFMNLMKTDRSKLLIPCYKDMDAYDLPEDFAHLQAQDMGKIGFINDVVRGIKKVVAKDEPVEVASASVAAPVSAPATNAAPLLERAFMFLEDEEWESADEYFEKVLDLEPKNAMAYLGKLCVELEVTNIDKLSSVNDDFENRANFKKVVRFADDFLKTKIDDILKKRDERVAEEKCKEREKELKQRELFKEKLEDNICRSRQKYISTSCHTVGLKSDGTVVAIGNNSSGQCNTYRWKDIIAVFAGDYHTVGLKSDGTVVAVGDNDDGQCGVFGWKNIVAVSAGCGHTVGIKSDGTVVAVGDDRDGQCDVSGWENIVAVSTGDYHTVGLKSDGTVVAVGNNDDGQCDVFGWENIVAVSAGCGHTIGLKSDGTVVAVGDDSDGQCDVSGWENIVAVSASCGHTIGLKSDGTVVAVGDNNYGQCDVENWKNISEVSAGLFYTAGLKSDGTVVAVGYNNNGKCDVLDWRNIATPLSKEEYEAKLKTEKARKEAALAEEKARREAALAEEKARREAAIAAEKVRKEAERKARIEYLNKDKIVLEEEKVLIEKEKISFENELANLKGLFTGKRKKEIIAKLEELDSRTKVANTRIKQINEELQTLK